MNDVVLPPSRRSRVALGLTAAAAVGRFELQSCVSCGAVQYPPREACCRCLSVDLEWKEQTDHGEVLAVTALHHSNEPYFRQRLPWAIGLIRMECGVIVVAHLHSRVTSAGMRVRVRLCLDRAGAAVVFAVPDEEGFVVSDDRVLSEMVCDPRSRNVLVTDASSAVGAALVHALVAAGAKTVWAGSCGAVVSFPGLNNVVPVALDVTEDASVAEAAASIGGGVDILVNTAERRLGADDPPPRLAAHSKIIAGAGAPAPREGGAAVTGVPAPPEQEAVTLDFARVEMEIHYFGLMRLMREFGPRMRSRNSGGQINSVTWVNLLSIHALAGSPANESFAAAEAATHSLSQSLRAQMLPAGIRVVNVFAGPAEQEAAGLAEEIVAALTRGLEDVYPGHVAQRFFAQWRQNPKGLERELSGVGR